MSHTRILPPPASQRRADWGSRRAILAALTTALVLTLLAPSTTLAAFTRPFVRQITGTPTGPGGATVPFAFNRESSVGIAVDSSNNLWVSRLSGPFDEFNSSGAFVEALEPTFGTHEPEAKELAETSIDRESLAVEDSTGHFYVAGQHLNNHPEVFASTGELLKRWQSGVNGAPPIDGQDPISVAVDNSTDPLDPSRCGLSVCTAYVLTTPGALSTEGEVVEKFTVNAAGEPTPAPFTGKASYIKGSELSPPIVEGVGSNIITVDSEGNIYVVIHRESKRQFKTIAEQVVAEYNPEGLLVREFSGENTPNLGQNGNEENGYGGYGETIQGVTVDPVSHHLLLAVSLQPGSGKGVVDEFSSSGSYLGEITEIETLPGVRTHLGEMSNMAADSSGDVYVVDTTAHAVDELGAGHALPSLTLAEVGARTPTTAVVSGSFDPESQPPSECSFEYVSEMAFKASGFTNLGSGGTAACEPMANTIPADSSSHPVRAVLVKLEAGTTYYYRLSATTSGAIGGASHSEPLPFTAPHAPRIDSISAANISSRFADLHAQVDPLGADTSYYFEYGPTTVYGSDAPALTQAEPHGVGIGPGGPTGSADVSVVQSVSGLAPGAEYHFRVVAENEIEGRAEITYGLDGTFATLPLTGEGLPDGRAYELLTPPNKGSAEDMFADPDGGTAHKFTNTSNVGYPSESGEEFILETKAAFGSSCGVGSSFAASATNVYVFRRDAAARCWQTLPLATPPLGVQNIGLDAFDPDNLSLVGLFDTVGSEASVAGTHGLDLLGSAGGPYQELHNEVETEGSQVVNNEGTKIVGASRDLSDTVVESLEHTLVSGASGLEQQDRGSHALYEWANGEFTLVSVNSEGSAFQCGAVLGQGDLNGTRHNAVSSDGSRIVFTAPDPYAVGDGRGCWGGHANSQSNPPQLYMRSAGQTIELSAPAAGVTDPTGAHPAVYVGASEDGSKVFFVSEGELTSEAVSLKLEDPELYECEIVQESTGAGCKLKRISIGEEGSQVQEPGSSGAHMYTVPAISADGSAVYFTAFGSLVPGAPALSPVSKDQEVGMVNLYRYDTGTGRTVYVATVNALDYPNQNTSAWETGANLGIDAGGAALSTLANWYSSPDGRYLLFVSWGEPADGFSTVEASPGTCPVYDTQHSAPIGHCSEVYRYDSRLPVSQGSPGVPDNPVCVSCDRSGAAPVSNAFFANTAGSEVPSGPPVRAMSDDGSCVFFDSADPLVTQAENHTLDVYEWEARGAYGCKPAQGTSGCELAQGCVSLISSGDDQSPSYLLGASADGSNVFFGTHARLVPEDTDSLGDLYDARVGGGFPVLGGKGPCEGAACQNPPPAPIDATPSSLTFSGTGNIAPTPLTTTAAKKKTKKKPKKKAAKCSKGKKLRHNKCVRRTSAKKAGKHSIKGRK